MLRFLSYFLLAGASITSGHFLRKHLPCGQKRPFVLTGQAPGCLLTIPFPPAPFPSLQLTSTPAGSLPDKYAVFLSWGASLCLGLGRFVHNTVLVCLWFCFPFERGEPFRSEGSALSFGQENLFSIISLSFTFSNSISIITFSYSKKETIPRIFPLLSPLYLLHSSFVFWVLLFLSFSLFKKNYFSF